MTSMSVLQSSLLYLYLQHQIWLLEKKTSHCEREDFLNPMKLTVLTCCFCICRLDDTNPKLDDSDPMLHLKVPPLKDSNPLCEGFGSLCLFFNQKCHLQYWIWIHILGIQIFCLVLHFPKWGIQILFVEIRILFSFQLSISIFFFFWNSNHFVEDLNRLAFFLKSSLLLLRDSDPLS